MIDRRPDLAKYGDEGMKPGLTNPLGARALYLFNEKGQDTLFRLHGNRQNGTPSARPPRRAASG